MKLFISFILFIFVINIQAQNISLAKYTGTKPLINGDLTEWEFAHWVSFHPADTNKKDFARASAMWNEQYLFLAFVVSNKNLMASRTERDQTGLYKDDGVEFLLDPNNDKSPEWRDDDIAYHINILNVLLDEKGNTPNGDFNLLWNGDIQSVVRLSGTINDTADTDEGYIVEIAMPWSYTGKTPYTGLEMGIDYCVNDTDDLTGKYRYYDWMGLYKFHNPSKFGTLILTRE